MKKYEGRDKIYFEARVEKINVETNSSVFQHKYETKGGDSGTPLILQHRTIYTPCSIMAIHRGITEKKGPNN